jgi:hypothetical protein
MKFALGIGIGKKIQKMGFMNFENELELEKYLENEIHEFRTWN